MRQDDKFGRMLGLISGWGGGLVVGQAGEDLGLGMRGV